MSKGMMKLFHNGGELPRIAQLAQFSPAGVPSNTTILAGVANKIIVPVWMMLMATHTAPASPQIIIRGIDGVGDNREKMLLDTFLPELAYGQPIFIDYGISLFRLFDVGEGIRLNVQDSSNGTYTITLGYYLIDP